MKKRIIYGPLSFKNLSISKVLPVMVLAPHPDDFDAIGVTMRLLYNNGNPLNLVVVTSAASGVENSFCSPPSKEKKSRIREREQTKSCQFFGLPERQLGFLRLEEDESGHPHDNHANMNGIRNIFF